MKHEKAQGLVEYSLVLIFIAQLVAWILGIPIEQAYELVLSSLAQVIALILAWLGGG